MRGLLTSNNNQTADKIPDEKNDLSNENTPERQAENRSNRASSDLMVPKDFLTHKPIENATAAGLEGCQVLLVDDNKVNQRITTKMLATYGCQVTVADNGLQGAFILPLIYALFVFFSSFKKRLTQK